MQHTLDETPSSKSKNKPRAPREERSDDSELLSTVRAGLPMLKRPPPMTSAPKPQNAQKYCTFHEQNGHKTAECRELRKALYELAKKGQIDRFLKRGPRFLQKDRELTQPEQRDKECSTEIVATIAGGYAEGITPSAWKAQLQGASKSLLRNNEAKSPPWCSEGNKAQVSHPRIMTQW
ncbi:hypothetical protein Cgig2_001152 [Carnegiea gigantea]|uniref:Reverse transcriptase domain-containing protein n=1 Tax=Carnegiea gigantea TaxID=171969 RepID=A0A9Q1QCV4_9CARY|nr:hypothetical protein Cgig2_001152 [Carnegiea gigantea]